MRLAFFFNNGDPFNTFDRTWNFGSITAISFVLYVSCSLGGGGGEGAYRLFYVKVGLLKYSSKFLISSCCSSIVCTGLINENISSEIFNLKPVSKSNFFLDSRQHRSQRIIRSENCQIFFENSKCYNFSPILGDTNQEHRG